MLCSNQANFYVIPLKSQTNNSSAFGNFFSPTPNDGPASTMRSFLSQLMVMPTSSFLHFHVPKNATSTASGLRIHDDSCKTSLNDVTINHVSTTTATMTAIMAHVTATEMQQQKCHNTSSLKLDTRQYAQAFCIPP